MPDSTREIKEGFLEEVTLKEEDELARLKGERCSRQREQPEQKFSSEDGAYERAQHWASAFV